MLFAVGFFAGLAMALAGFVLMLIGIARAVVNSFRPLRPQPSLTPAGTQVLGANTPAFEEDQEQRALRQLQIALVVFILLPAASVTASIFVMLSRRGLAPTFVLIIAAYVLSELPYVIALVRTRPGPDRLGIAIAFAASCVLIVEGFLPFLHFQNLRVYTVLGFLSWSGLFLIGHVVVAVLAWRAGRLLPPQSDDLPLIVGSIVGVVAYLAAIRFLELHFLPRLLMR
jgi:hypothetical protein